MGQAAAELGLSVEAIRKRIQRGTIHSEKGPDGRRYVYLDESHHEVPGEGSLLVESLQDQVGYLRTQLEAERQAHAEARRLLAAALERIPPAIEPPRSPEMADDEQQGRGPVPNAGGPQEGTERPEGHDRVPWWRRIFGE